MDITLDDKLSALQQINQQKLVKILDAISGSKDLIIEQKLMKILDSFVGVTVLKRYGVDKIYKLEEGLKTSNSQRIFLVSNSLIACKRVLDQIQSEISLTGKPHVQVCHHLLVVPFVPPVLHNLVEEEGLSELLTLQTFSIEFIKLDGNVLSFENPMFVELYYHKDTSSLRALARNLWSLQLILGSPRLSLFLGKHSQQMSKLMESMEQSLGSSSLENEVGAFIMMDRSFDLATTLLTPVTYAGLLNEVVEINIGIATLEKSQIRLDPNKDQIYGEVRDTPCSDAFPILHRKAKSLKSEQEAVQTMKLAEMERYVSTRLQRTRDMTQQLAFHISACQAIADTVGSEFQVLQTIEKLMLDCKDRKECLSYIERNIDEHELRCLRLLCLLSITTDGVTQNEILDIQKMHLHTHGYQHIPLFYKLRTTGLLKYRNEYILHKLPNWSSEWSSNAQKLKMLPGSLKRSDQNSRTCPSYVFNNAYIPAIAQILNIVLNQEKDPRSFEDLTNLPTCIVNGHRGALSPKMVVICIIGGITCAEIAACRLIEKSTGIRLVLTSDTILTGNKLIQRIKKI
ncbi:Vacuolar protein sorting-associated protein 33B [Trachymyrmex septentrionalis]|uniref:Vacuolar protein sorting-associated protein 33B n=2 Tax=Trachymyrmex septentrionalis TaxID=34720 RepID=A0A151JWF3_9HYME|nr:PREDICTED: vacuolar protein sorting-associated protein 33B isoform X1 [Trachymyrmex septentrionalis]KYN38666.1 Vacuolar protein sorting-associated protein 33B [Trachymyrmex septentrionalis]